MKPVRLLALAGTCLLLMSNGCEKEPAAPDNPLATGRIVRVEITVDSQGQNPRPRWEIDVAPLSFPGVAPAGVAEAPYQQVKAFDLPDTAAYKAGRVLQFRYRLVPLAQHTPWRTFYEQMNTAAGIAWGDRLPELALSDVRLTGTH